MGTREMHMGTGEMHEGLAIPVGHSHSRLSRQGLRGQRKVVAELLVWGQEKGACTFILPSFEAGRGAAE
jgi:hypothetical protein